MKTELFIENKRLDLTEGISSLLTFAIDDIKDFASRNTTFSKTIILPGTANNNALFGFIFDAKISNPYDSTLDNVATNFNASVSASAIMFQDHIQVFKGTIRLLEIVITDGVPEYECAVFGELGGLVAALGAKKIEDLDFSAYDVLWTESNIAASWSNTPGSGVFFPSNIDYGKYSDLKHNWDFRGMRPALYVKEYIDKIFADTTYTYQSNLFNTARFKGLIIPQNQRLLNGKVSRILTAGVTSTHLLIHTLTGISSNKVDWDTSIAGGFTYLAGTYTFTGAVTLNTTLTFRLVGHRTSVTPGNFNIYIRKNGVSILSNNIPTSSFNAPYSWLGSVAVSLSTGDTVDIFYQYGGTGIEQDVTIEDGSTMVMDSDIVTTLPIDYNQLITINDAIPKNILQKDFLSSIIKLFNLYVYEDRDEEKKVFIEPYVDFFDLNVSGVVDWNYKMDRSRSIRIRPMSELNSRYYNFNFKSDADFFNDLYNKRYNQTYGSLKYDSAFQFTNESNEIPLIFSGTPLVGYDSEDKIYSTLFKLNSGVEDNIDTNIRILQSKNVSGVSSWNILDGVTSLASYTSYGYAGHYDDPDAPANDIQFGVPAELFFVLVSGAINVTQFNVYWSSYMAEITDKDSKLLTAWFKLSNKDIYDLDFSKFIHVDGSYWRLNKITDWNASEPDVCQCELLKLINMVY